MKTYNTPYFLRREDRKYWTSSDMPWLREWVWLKKPYVAFSAVTGEIKDIRSFKRKKNED